MPGKADEDRDNGIQVPKVQVAGKGAEIMTSIKTVSLKLIPRKDHGKPKHHEMLTINGGMRHERNEN